MHAMHNEKTRNSYIGHVSKQLSPICRDHISMQGHSAIDILYTLDSAFNYSTIQKLKPWLQTQDIPMKWEDSYVFYFLNTELKY
jgi:hypothetical protein